MSNLEEFFASAAIDIQREVEPKCGCPAAPKPTLSDVQVVAVIDGQPFIYSFDAIEAATVDLIRKRTAFYADAALSAEAAR